MKLRKIAAVSVALGLFVGGIAMAGPASADPVSGGYVLVGSDTLQDSLNAITNGTTITSASVRVTAGGNTLGNFDAFGSARVQTKPGGPFFVRPAGSGNGVLALRASITGAAFNGTAITGQVDIARSSSGPGSNASTAGLLAYVPYGRDAVAYAYKGDSAALGNLTTAQLTQLYTAASVGAATTVNGVVVTPRLPQNGSGTRSFFLAAIGVTAATLGGAVNDTGNTTPENDASVLGANEIIPFSVANWVAQSNGAAPSTIGSTGVQIGSPIGTAPFTGTGSALVPNPAFYSNATWGRDTYLVVEYARVNSADPKYDPALAKLVDPTQGLSSLTSFGTLPSTPGAVKKKFGFLAPSSTAPIRAYTTL